MFVVQQSILWIIFDLETNKCSEYLSRTGVRWHHVRGLYLKESVRVHYDITGAYKYPCFQTPGTSSRIGTHRCRRFITSTKKNTLFCTVQITGRKQNIEKPLDFVFQKADNIVYSTTQKYRDGTGRRSSELWPVQGIFTKCWRVGNLLIAYKWCI